MTIFLITPLENNAEAIGSAINERISQGWLQAHNITNLPNDSGWLINWGGTAIDLSNFIGITKPPVFIPPPQQSIGITQGIMNPPPPLPVSQHIANTQPNLELGSALVTSVSSYYGVAPVSVWDWIQSRMEGR